MKRKIQFNQVNRFFSTSAAALLLAALVFSASPAAACGSDDADLALIRLARQAVAADESSAARAIADLRACGQAGLEALFTVHAEAIKRHNAGALTSSDPAAWERVSKALDAVGQQRDCATSRLYWHTDIDQARAAARASGKPILSLRLLGRLDEEMSCANSRFFRTALYANSEISQFLRDHFVLHWQSVRPAPRLTIDFGDGRKLERTITGNSIHYVLDADGRPIDALPGLYGPKAFLESLRRVETAVRQYAALPQISRSGFLAEYHRTRALALRQQWQADLERAGVVMPIPASSRSSARETTPTPIAARAALAAVSKSQVERPLIRAVAPNPVLEPSDFEAAMNAQAWSSLATLHADDARLDAASRKLMLRKADAAEAMQLAVSKRAVESPLLRAGQQFERSMAEDTVRNEYLFHAKIHQWFAAALPQTSDVAALNEKVYAELFLTPGSDPWLGLKPAGVYSAIEGDGIIAVSRK